MNKKKAKPNNCTPGEWKEFEGYLYSETDQGFKIIADLVGPEGNGFDPDGDIFAGHVPLSKAEAQANRRLIAAAPELLAALIACYENDDVNEAMPDHILKQVEEAIAKAEGKASD